MALRRRRGSCGSRRGRRWCSRRSSRWCRSWGSFLGRSRRRLSTLLGIQRPNAQLARVLLQDPLVVVFPKLLRGVLSSHSRQNCNRMSAHSLTPKCAVVHNPSGHILFFPPMMRRSLAHAHPLPHIRAGPRVKDSPGCSSWNCVKSKTSSSITTHRLSGLLCEDTSSLENALAIVFISRNISA